MINEITIELMVPRVEQSVHFYQEVLGFELLAKEEEDQAGIYWALMSLNGFRVSFKEERRMKKEVEYLKDSKIGSSAAICFRVDDLEGHWEKIKYKYDLLNHPHITPCGSTQFSMKDLNGYLLTFERF